MVKKKVVKKKVDRKIIRKSKVIRIVKSPWFRVINPKHNWGFIPINSKGGIALILLIGINVFAANYFNLNMLVFDNWSKFGVVFLLSFFIFIEIAMRKTRK